MRKGFMLATASAAAMATATAFAQDDVDDTDDVDTIVVTGFRQSVEQALDIKRNRTQIVDSIVAEDIGKLPDQNVVEALQRVTGVQVTDRSRGETSGLTIRGLPDVTTTWNGRNVFTGAGGALALQDIPASLVSRIDVYKTRAADQIEAGLAGQIDVVTRRPLDFDGLKFTLNADARYDEPSEKTDPTVNALLSYSADTGIGKLGALASVSYRRISYREQAITAGAAVPYATEAGGPEYDPLQLVTRNIGPCFIYQPGALTGLPTAPGSTLTRPIDTNGTAEGCQYPAANEFEYYLARDAVFQSDIYGERERPAASLAFQWAPNEDATYTVEYLYQGYREELFNSLHFQFVDWWGSLPSPVTDTFNLYDGTNVISDRTVFDAFGFNSGDVTESSTDTHAVAFNAEWSLLDDALNIEADVSYQKSDFETDFFAGRIERVAPQVSVDFNEDDGIPAWNFGDTQNLLTDPSAWTVGQLFDNAGADSGDAFQLFLDGDYELGGSSLMKRVSFGLRYDDRGTTSGTFDRNPIPFLGRPLTDFPELQYVNDDYFQGDSNTPGSWINIDGRALYANRDFYRTLWNPDAFTGAAANPIDNFDIEQETFSLYGMADFETLLAGRNLFVQAGLRYTNISTTSDFLDRTVTPETYITVETDDDAFLPSVIVVYDLFEDVKLRFNYGETIRRPAFADINPTPTYAADINNDGLDTGSSGNQDLSATTATNYDFSAEWYFGDDDALYATLFHREIEDFVITETSVIEVGQDIIDQFNLTTGDVSFSRPVNASDGTLTGAEIGFVYWPDYLPPVIDGFGLLGSMTILDSEQDGIPVFDAQTGETFEISQSFFGVSDFSYNITGAYERGPFGARLSYVWRDDFLARNEAPDFANPIGIYRQSDPSLDFSANLALGEHLSLTFDAVNLTDTIQKEYYQFEDSGGPEIFNFGNLKIGRSFRFGLRYQY